MAVKDYQPLVLLLFIVVVGTLNAHSTGKHRKFNYSNPCKYEETKNKSEDPTSHLSLIKTAVKKAVTITKEVRQAICKGQNAPKTTPKTHLINDTQFYYEFIKLRTQTYKALTTRVDTHDAKFPYKKRKDALEKITGYLDVVMCELFDEINSKSKARFPSREFVRNAKSDAKMQTDIPKTINASSAIMFDCDIVFKYKELMKAFQRNLRKQSRRALGKRKHKNGGGKKARGRKRLKNGKKINDNKSKL